MDFLKIQLGSVTAEGMPAMRRVLTLWETSSGAVRLWVLSVLFLLPLLSSCGQERLRVVELNAENLFDTRHDPQKVDYDFLPGSPLHWTCARYWQKLNRIGQEIVACGEDSSGCHLPDLVGLCEVENDIVLRDLTRHSLLRKARYKYVMTASPDIRGIDVALLYSPFSFRFLRADTVRIIPLKGMRPTRDILHVEGEVQNGDTLHVFLIHAPSRRGGEKRSRPFRLHVMERLCQCVDSLLALSAEKKIIVMGDFNDYDDSPSLQMAYRHGLVDVSRQAKGRNGAKSTYRYQGEWRSLDHILVSKALRSSVRSCRIADAPFLLEEDRKYGGVKPRRFYSGKRFNNGFSDHLPLVMELEM